MTDIQMTEKKFLCLNFLVIQSILYLETSFEKGKKYGLWIQSLNPSVNTWSIFYQLYTDKFQDMIKIRYYKNQVILCFYTVCFFLFYFHITKLWKYSHMLVYTCTNITEISFKEPFRFASTFTQFRRKKSLDSCLFCKKMFCIWISPTSNSSAIHLADIHFESWLKRTRLF